MRRQLRDGLPSLSYEAFLRQDDRSDMDALLDTANRRGEASSCRCATIRSLLPMILALVVVGSYLSLFAYVEGNSMSYETVVVVNNATETAHALRRRELEQKRMERQEQRARAQLERSVRRRRRDMVADENDDDDDRDNQRRREKPPRVSLWRVGLMYLLVRYWINLHRADDTLEDANVDENNASSA
jgi:C4-dicarboxylate-specific signal transduction histidine kinase